MRVKELDKTANMAWSPAPQHPVYIATGTAAQQLDATFSTTAALEIYKFDLSDPGLGMEMVGSVETDCRFHKLAWGSHGMSDGSTPNGVLCAGGDNGKVYIYNPSKLINNEGDALIHKLDEHSGNVAALDINPFQANLLATGGSESEIYIYDISSPGNPMTPGAKSQPPDDVTCLSWNRQVQHILASTYSGRCVVWDLRKNEPIIKVSDSMSRIKCKLVGWHPDVATQMCLASEDDHSPVVQLWDLRFATSPLKSLENHQRGILSMAWCPQDPDLLLTCGKDNRILCWNPNSAVQTGEVVYEVPTTNQWSFDVQWCPRNPGVISSCSFDGHISVYSLMGGGHPPATPTDKVADSFPADPFAPGFQQQQQKAAVDPSAQILKKAPKWLRRPVGASFAFGGKLITFESVKPEHPQQAIPRHVNMSQVVTESELVSRSNQLETALTNNQYQEFCAMKIANSKSSQDEEIWNFLKVQFDKDARTRYLQLLGYDQTDLSKKVAEVTGESKLADKAGVNADELADKMSMLNADDLESEDTAEPEIKHEQGDASAPSQMSNGVDAFEQIAAQNEKGDSRSDSPLPISTDTDFEGLVTQSLLLANFEAAVEVCIHHNKMAEAITLAIAGGPELLLRTQKRFFQSSKSDLNRLMSSLITRDFEHVVRTCELENWKEALAMSLTYARADEFANLCDILGARMESEKHGQHAINACLCYICAGNVEKLVQCWNKLNSKTTPTSIQDLVEKVMVLRKAVEMAQGRPQQVAPGVLAEKLSEYAGMLAGQGSLHTAVSYLGSSNEPSLATLRYRLHHAIGQGAPGGVGSQCPFPVIDVKPEGMRQPAQPQAIQQQQQARGRGTGSAFHQTQAGSFQTTTTPSSTNQYSSQYNASSTSTYSQPAPVSAAGSIGQKGHMAHKYPTAYPGQPAVSSAYDPYAQQIYNPAAMQQPGYGASQPTATSQPQIYNPAVAAAQQTPGSHPTSPLATPPPSRRPSDPPSGCEFTTEDEKGAPYVPPAASSAAAGPAATPASGYQPANFDPGWNDPPPVSSRKKEPAQYERPAAITQPIFGVPQPQEQAPPGAPNYGGTQMYNPQAYQQQQQHMQQQQQPAAPAPVQPKAPAPVVKGPIPAEHQVLHDVLDKLVNQCLATATNPQTKRKLEDVLRKLETLYDKLRENRLSQNVTLGLHQIIQAIQAYDYNTGLAYHTQMISQGNFSEISSFMPGIKMLMQTATQLQVYVK